MNAKTKKNYLLVAGTFLPAFTGIAVLSLIRKHHKVDTGAVVLFGALTVAGAYLTTKMMHQKEN